MQLFRWKAGGRSADPGVAASPRQRGTGKEPRIKAVATVSMYDISQAHRQGLAENVDPATLKKNLAEISKPRWAEADGAERTMAIGTPQKITEKSSDIDKEFYDYDRTPRGQHPRSSTALSSARSQFGPCCGS